MVRTAHRPTPRAVTGPAHDLAPSLAHIDSLARQALAELPADVRDACDGLVIRVADLADDAMLDELGIDDAYELTGLYDGTPLTEKSQFDQPLAPDAVWLFRRAILEEWIERGDVALDKLVAHVLVHEIAHHLGWSDDDILRIDDWTE